MQNCVSQIRYDANIPAQRCKSAKNVTSPYAITEPDEPGIPEGYQRLQAGGPYFRQMGPVYTRRSSDGQVTAPHCGELPPVAGSSSCSKARMRSGSAGLVKWALKPAAVARSRS